MTFQRFRIMFHFAPKSRIGCVLSDAFVPLWKPTQAVSSDLCLTDIVNQIGAPFLPIIARR